MTTPSLEIVKVINDLREDGGAVLTHSDFMKKVEKMLGKEGAGKFSDTYTHPQNGQIYSCYHLPRREAVLMVEISTISTFKGLRLSRNQKLRLPLKRHLNAWFKEKAKEVVPELVIEKTGMVANNPVSTTPPNTMSSTEIAGLTGKNHHAVLHDIRTHLYAGLYSFEFDNRKIVYPSIQGLTVVDDDENTKRTKEILLDRYHTDILISGYEVKYRAAIVKRWHELEGGGRASA